MGKFIDLTNKIFGRLTILYRVENKMYSNKPATQYKCHCECGNIVIKERKYFKKSKNPNCGCEKFLYGEKHPRFKKDKTEKDITQRRLCSGIKYKKIRNNVYIRDSYTCQICYIKGGKLNVHHLDGWHWCKEKRFDPDNMITLCIKCHKKFHNLYGRRNNTHKQFTKFKNNEIHDNSGY